MNLFDKIFITAVVVLYNVQTFHTSRKQIKKLKENEKYERLLKYFNDHPSY